MTMTCPLYIGHQILSNVNLLLPHIKGKQVLIVTQKNIAELYLNDLQNNLSGYQRDVVYLQQGEQHKNIESWQTIIEALVRNKHERDTTLIALGGLLVGCK